jgi:hypothetical protein
MTSRVSGRGALQRLSALGAPLYVVQCHATLAAHRGAPVPLSFGGPELVDEAIQHHAEWGHAISVYRYTEQAEVPVLRMAELT